MTETTFLCQWCSKRKPLSALGKRMSNGRCKCKTCCERTRPGGLPLAA